MASNKTKLTLALGSAIAASLAGTASPAADNPFSAQSLGRGYMVAADDATPAEKTNEGNCGNMKGDMKGAAKKGKDGSCGNMKKKKHRDCDAMKKKMMEDNKPIDMEKAKQMNCGANMKMDDKK